MRWNACYAVGRMLHNENLAVGEAPWTVSSGQTAVVCWSVKQFSIINTDAFCGNCLFE